MESSNGKTLMKVNVNEETKLGYAYKPIGSLEDMLKDFVWQER